MMKRTWICLFVLSLCLSDAMAGDDVFTVASLNVDGLPTYIGNIHINPDGPGGETVRVGQFLARKGYDLIGVQEDFNYDEELRSVLEPEYCSGQWQGGIDLSFLKIWKVLFGDRFDTDGLRVFWRSQHVVEQEEAVAWYDSYGKFDHCWDAIVRKGFHRCEMTLLGGQRIVVYNMHMDAADDQDEATQNDTKDKAARMAQWAQLKDDVLQQLDSRPIIIVGDMNSLYSRDDVKSVFIDAINDSGRGTVADVWMEMNKQGEETVDKILYINPVLGTMIQPVAYSVDKDGYQNEGKPLGDHYPVAATFKVISRATGIETMDDGRSKMEEERVYDLNGQQVSQPKKGIFIEKKGGKSDKRVFK